MADSHDGSDELSMNSSLVISSVFVVVSRVALMHRPTICAPLCGGIAFFFEFSIEVGENGDVWGKVGKSTVSFSYRHHQMTTGGGEDR